MEIQKILWNIFNDKRLTWLIFALSVIIVYLNTDWSIWSIIIILMIVWYIYPSINISYKKNFLFPFVWQIVIFSIPLFLGEFDLVGAFFNKIEFAIFPITGLFILYILIITAKLKGQNRRYSILWLLLGFIINFLSIIWMFSRVVW